MWSRTSSTSCGSNTSSWNAPVRPWKSHESGVEAGLRSSLSQRAPVHGVYPAGAVRDSTDSDCALSDEDALSVRPALSAEAADSARPAQSPSPVRAGWTTGCSSPSMPANESDAAAVTSLNLRSSASSNARNPAESIVNGVRMVCSLSVACLRAPAPQLAAGAHGCHIPMLLAPTPRPEQRMWISGRHSGHPQPPCRLWMDAARSGFFQPVFRLVICFLAYSSIF